MDGVLSIAAKDIDKDGYIDIVSASNKDNKIAWYKNTNGTGDFSTEQIITSNMIGVQSLNLVDIDNDGYLDVLSAASTPTSAFQGSMNNKIAWFKNTSGNFDNELVISTKAIGAKYASTTDINGDGYIDVISASEDDNKVAWYKNTSTDNLFEDARIISRQVRFPSEVYAGDFDGDLDIDILSLSQHNAQVAWYENTNGKGLFGNQRIITEKIGTGNSVPTAFPVDIDGDGDLDIAVGKRDELSWYENKDGKGAFGAQQIIYVSGATNGTLVSMEIADIDGDGDDDIIASAFNDVEIQLYENINGSGSFLSRRFNAKETGAIYPADIDGDNDVDIVAVSRNGNRNDSISWYENVTGNGTFSIEHNISEVEIYGNSIHAIDVDNDGDMDVLTASGHPQN